MANLSNINNKFLVTTGGNVLIGQTSAIGSSIFQVTGNSTFAGNVTVGNSGNINIPTAASGNANLHFDGTDFKITSNSSSANLKLETSSTTRLTINSTGNATFAGNVYAPSLASSDTSGRYFMIQNAAGNQTYPVYSFRTDGNTGMMNPGADILSLVTGGTTRLTINNSSSTFAGTVTAPNLNLTNLTQNTTSSLFLVKDEVLGAELVTNGDFDTATGWTAQSGWAVSSGKANGTATTGARRSPRP